VEILTSPSRSLWRYAVSGLVVIGVAEIEEELPTGEDGPRFEEGAELESEQADG
jgi:hypothetical protein